MIRFFFLARIKWRHCSQIYHFSRRSDRPACLIVSPLRSISDGPDDGTIPSWPQPIATGRGYREFIINCRPRRYPGQRDNGTMDGGHPSPRS